MKLYKSKEIRSNEVEVLFWNEITDKYYEDADNFHAPINGGYVRNSNGSQICEKMLSTGNTLSWNGKGKFIDFIRKELKKYSVYVKKIKNM